MVDSRYRATCHCPPRPHAIMALLQPAKPLRHCGVLKECQGCKTKFQADEKVTVCMAFNLIAPNNHNKDQGFSSKHPGH